MCLLGGFALCGLGCNLVLYFDDIKNRGGILDKVPGATETIAALMATPQIPKKEFVKAAPADYTAFNKDFGEEVEVVVGLPDLQAYKDNPSFRDALRRSQARSSVVK